MKFEVLMVEIKNKFPDVHKIFTGLVDDLKSLLNNFSADSTGITFGEIKWLKGGLLESVHGIFVRQPLECDSPVCAVYRMDGGDLAGAGSFRWDSIVHQEVGYFVRAGGNTQIQVTKKGKYLVVANVLATGVVAGARANAGVKVNTVFDVRTLGYAGFDEFIPFCLTTIINCNANDLIEVHLDAGNRYGQALGKFTQMSIHKLN